MTVLISVFPDPSVAVTVKVCDLLQEPVMVPATAVIAGVPQLSVALDAATTLAVVGNVVGLQPNAKSVVGTVNKGFSSSVTVTVCVQLAVFPETSVTVQVTVVVPIEKLAGALLVTEITPQLSVVGALPNKTPEAVHKPASAETVTFSGQLISGASVSATSVISLLKVGFGVAQDFNEYALHITLSPTEMERVKTLLAVVETIMPFTFHSYKVNGPPFIVVAVNVLFEGEIQSVVEDVEMETEAITI